MNLVLWILTFLSILFSFIKNKSKTKKALKIAFKKCWKILPLFLFVMTVFSIVITYLSQDLIHNSIGAESGVKGLILSIFLGSISIMPGFAAFPLCAALRGEGIPLYIIAAFSITLMNIGIVTFPIEKKLLGMKVAIIRNIFALIITLITIGAVMLVFGESL